MSYLVLARKYRPRIFAEMVGQDHVVRALTNALQTQRLHHAYLFTGTRGVGKTTVSRILAKSLNCVGIDGQGGITAQPCGQCQACRDIDAGRFVDYVELDAASNRGVEEISQLLEQAVYKPVVGRFKVFMIDEVHMLSNTAFNAMLKTLEEPPDYLKFVLATTDPQKVPVTVLSRCLQFNLKPMAAQTIYEHLQQVLTAEQITFDAGSLRMMSRAAHGSMRDALSLADQAIAYGSGQVQEEAVRQMLGAVDCAYIYKIIEALASGDGKTVVSQVDFMREQGLSAGAALEEISAVLQQVAVLQVAPNAIEENDPDANAVSALVPLLDPDVLQLLYSIVLRGQNELGLASDEYAALMMVLLRFIAFSPEQKKNSEIAPPSVHVQEFSQPNTQRPVSVAPLDNVLSDPVSIHSPSTPAPEPEQRCEELTPITPVVESLLEVKTNDAQSCPPEQEYSASGKEVASSLSGQTVNELKAIKKRPTVRIDDQIVHPFDADTGDLENDIPPWVVAAWTEEQATAAISQTQAYSKGVLEDEEAPSEGQFLSAQAALDALPPGNPITDRWAIVVEALDAQGLVSALARELALNSQAKTISEGETTWVLLCERQTLLQDTNKCKLEQALNSLLGHTVELMLECAPTRDTPSLRKRHHEQQKLAYAQRQVESDPDVQKWLQQFPGARIVPGSVKAL